MQFFTATAWLRNEQTQAGSHVFLEKHDTTIFLSSLWTSEDKIPTNSTTDEFVNMHADKKLNPGEYQSSRLKFEKALRMNFLNWGGCNMLPNNKT